MAINVVYNFYSPTIGESVTVFFDDSTNEFFAIGDGGGNNIIGITIPISETGFNQNGLISSYCVGFDLYQFLATATAPFAYLNIISNSTTCGYIDPSCSTVIDVQIQNTTNGQNNGKITVIANGTPPFLYSLDNSSWQTSNLFYNLFNGTYAIYVKGVNNGCFASKTGVIINNVMDSIALPPKLIPFEDSRNICYYFKLWRNGTQYVIREPLKWDVVNILGERDLEYHGYLSKYSDGNIDLGFDCESGMDIIEEEYNEKGVDGEIKFEFGYLYNGNLYYLFLGKLILSTRKKFVDRIECSVESEDIDSATTSRSETNVSMVQTQTFDNSPIVPPTPYDLKLHAKEILSKTQCDKSSYYTSNIESGDTKDYFIINSNEDTAVKEITEYFELQSNDTIIDPTTVDELTYRFASDGTFNLTYSANTSFSIQVRNPSVTNSRSYDASIFCYRKRKNIANNTFFYEKINISNTNSGSVPPLSTVNRNFSLQGFYILTNEKVYIGEELYFYVHITFSEVVRRIKVDNHNSHVIINATFLEKSEETLAKVWFLDDVIRHNISCISDNKYQFKSTLFERANPQNIKDGSASMNVLTNGFLIRNFDINNRPLKINLKSILESLKAIYCIGYNYSSSNSKQVFNIERVDFFYRDNEILVIEEVDEYKETIAVELMYNELSFGYNKWQNEGTNTLDEFATTNESLTPLKKVKKKLQLISSFITSGYLIENQRREQFNKSQSDSVANDEETFMINVKRNGSKYITAKDEDFMSVQNVISPTTAYNLLITPKRMMYNWFIWIKGMFDKKVLTESIKVTVAKQNNLLLTQLRQTIDGIGDLNKYPIQEKQDILLSEMASTNDIWKPEWVDIKCRLTPNQMQVLNLALSGKYGSSKDYGYLLVKNPNGKYQAGWVYKVNYTIAKEQAEIRMLKKYSSPNAPNEDCCKWLLVNNCNLLVNNKRIII